MITAETIRQCLKEQGADQNSKSVQGGTIGEGQIKEKENGLD